MRFPARDMFIWQLHELVVLLFQNTNIMTYDTEIAYIIKLVASMNVIKIVWIAI